MQDWALVSSTSAGSPYHLLPPTGGQRQPLPLPRERERGERCHQCSPPPLTLLLLLCLQTSPFSSSSSSSCSASRMQQQRTRDQAGVSSWLLPTPNNHCHAMSQWNPQTMQCLNGTQPNADRWNVSNPTPSNY